MGKTDERIYLNYPVVLVHGIHANDRNGQSWGRIPQFLTDCGVPVYFGGTDGWGSYETNAAQLKAAIEQILAKTRTEKVNIIAHSKGGIDARYLIWRYNFGGQVASLTTIASPHQGSELADLLYRRGAVRWGVSKKILGIFEKVYGDTSPDVHNVNLELTTEKMKEFNERVLMDEGVYFQSLYTVMDGSLDDLVFSYTYRYIKKNNGENDGVVSSWSAMWGTNVRKIADGVSHAEIIDLKKRTISGIDIPRLYAAIARDLSRRGF
ncbi:hypothetical protein AGMMS50230_00070 [Spirochaetia bacterium]|nr:hypothetical protein AGMMS50230_00070 [Spirochaetia bacterium]